MTHAPRDAGDEFSSTADSLNFRSLPKKAFRHIPYVVSSGDCTEQNLRAGKMSNQLITPNRGRCRFSSSEPLIVVSGGLYRDSWPVAGRGVVPDDAGQHGYRSL